MIDYFFFKIKKKIIFLVIGWRKRIEKQRALSDIFARRKKSQAMPERRRIVIFNFFCNKKNKKRQFLIVFLY